MGPTAGRKRSHGGAQGAADHAGEQQLAPHRPVDREEYPHEGTIMTDSVTRIWGTDMTQTISTGESRDYVVITVDHCSGG